MTMRPLFWTTLVLGLCFATSLHAEERPPDPPVDQQVIVMFETDAAALPNGATRAEIGKAQLPGPVKGLLQRAGARRMAKGFPGFRRADTLRVLDDGRIYRVPDYTNLFVVTLPPNTNRDSVVARLNRLSEWVKYAEKNQRPAPRLSSGSRSRATLSHNDNLDDEVIPPDQDDFDKQWGLRNTSGPDIEATKAWTYTKGSSNVTIGVVDGGVEGSHVELSGKVSGYTLASDHGTSMAGTAAAKGDNSSGKVAGVDWRAQIHSEPLSGDLVNTAQSIDDAVMAGASVINNSWGFADRSTTLTQALRSAYKADVLLVHANPYESGPAVKTSNYPNNVGPWIVNVGAMNQNGSAYSNTGARSFTDVGAPGVDIYTTTVSYGPYDYRTGTSYAAPFVTGTASLLLSVEPSLRAHDIEHLLERTAQSYGSGHDPEVGYGMIDANAAVQRVSDPYEVTHGTASFTKIYNDDSVSFPDGFTKDNGTSYGAGTYICDIYKLRATSSSSYYYEEKPWFWLPVTERGFSAANPNDGSRYLSKSVSKSSAEATTYFYYVETNINGQEIGWVPFDPTVHKRNGSFEYTVIGKPDMKASLSGPGSLDSGQEGTWYASVTGGSGSTSYDWSYQPPGSYSWYSKSCTGSSCSHTFYGDNESAGMRVTVTKGSETDQATASVYISGSSSDCPPDEVCIKAQGKEIAVRNPSVETQADRTAELEWSVTSSLPSATFHVQHRTDTTAAWSTLGRVSPSDSVQTDATSGPAYRFQTEQLEVGTHEFRFALQHGDTQIHTAPLRAEITLSEAYELAAYPNPIRNQATVELAVKKSQEVRVGVFDILGRRLSTLHRGRMPSQETMRFSLDALNIGLTSGPYFVRVRGDTFTATRRITVVR